MSSIIIRWLPNFNPCLFLRLWDKLSQALSRSGGNRMLEETEKPIWVLPVHARVRIQDQGQQLWYVRSSSSSTSGSLGQNNFWTEHAGLIWNRSGSEEETFFFPQSNETDTCKGTSAWKNNTGDSALSDRSTQTDPGVWTPEKKDKRGSHHNHHAHASPERKVRPCQQKPNPTHANHVFPAHRGAAEPVFCLPGQHAATQNPWLLDAHFLLAGEDRRAAHLQRQEQGARLSAPPSHFSPNGQKAPRVPHFWQSSVEQKLKGFLFLDFSKTIRGLLCVSVLLWLFFIWFCSFYLGLTHFLQTFMEAAAWLKSKCFGSLVLQLDSTSGHSLVSGENTHTHRAFSQACSHNAG